MHFARKRCSIGFNLVSFLGSAGENLHYLELINSAALLRYIISIFGVTHSLSTAFTHCIHIHECIGYRLGHAGVTVDDPGMDDLK